MPTSRAWRGAPRRLIIAFVLVLLVPAAAVVWLGVRLVDQDRALASRQLRELRETAADRVVAGLEQALSSTERRVAGGAAVGQIAADDDAVVVSVGPAGFAALPAKRLFYQPGLPPDADAPEFEAGEALEFQSNNYAAAAAVYRPATASADSAVRAGGLLRLARTLRKMGRADEALHAYAELAKVGNVRLSGVPADLLARRASCSLLEELGRTRELEREARSLGEDLSAVRWPLDRGTFESYAQQVSHWTGVELSLDIEREALSEAAEWVWRQSTGSAQGEFQRAGRRARRFGPTSVTLLWQPTGGRVDVLIAGPRYQQREWFATPISPVDARGFSVALSDEDGQLLPAVARDANRQLAAQRAAAATRLPWTVLVSGADAGALGETAARRRLLLAGLALLVGLVVAGGYFVVRAISRELAVARLQSDFVAAVSHEFRTPLTSLRQFTDLLNDDPEAPAAVRRPYYEAQSRATERLRRLVESLLDFGRMEAGARPYRLERRPLGPLVAGIVDSFRQDAAPKGFSFEMHGEVDGAEVRVDPDAFTLALWNLLDNAVKYSGASRVVVVSVAASHGAAAIRVCDNGYGIARREQREIFDKFARGTASREHGIRGTGIGLAMVRHIVDAHGGTIAVESAPGRGSTFEIALPTEAACRES